MKQSHPFMNLVFGILLLNSQCQIVFTLTVDMIAYHHSSPTLSTWRTLGFQILLLLLLQLIQIKLRERFITPENTKLSIESPPKVHANGKRPYFFKVLV
ncbi:hypothetical protein V8E54_015246 [Elaphomyces granulatus]